MEKQKNLRTLKIMVNKEEEKLWQKTENSKSNPSFGFTKKKRLKGYKEEKSGQTQSTLAEKEKEFSLKNYLF